MSQERNFIFKPHEYCESRMQRDNVLMAENSQDCSLGEKWLHTSMWIELRRHREGDQKMTSGEVSQKMISGEKKCGTRGQKDLQGGGPGLGIKNYSSISLPIACCKIATSRNHVWVTEEGRSLRFYGKIGVKEQRQTGNGAAEVWRGLLWRQNMQETKSG